MKCFQVLQGSRWLLLLAFFLPFVLAISSRRAYKEIIICSQAGIDSNSPSDSHLWGLDWVMSLFTSSLNWKQQYLAWQPAASDTGKELCKWGWLLVMTLCSVPRRYLQTPGDPGTIGVTSEIYQQFPSFHTNLRLDFFFFFLRRVGDGESILLWHFVICVVAPRNALEWVTGLEVLRLLPLGRLEESRSLFSTKE